VFHYTVMRAAKPALEVGPNSHEELWIVWDVEADNPEDAVTEAADIPATYVVFDADGIVFEVDNVTRLEVVQRDAE